MTTADTQRGVLIFGRRQPSSTRRSPGDLGFKALGTNDFSSDVASRFDIRRDRLREGVLRDLRLLLEALLDTPAQ